MKDEPKEGSVLLRVRLPISVTAITDIADIVAKEWGGCGRRRWWRENDGWCEFYEKDLDPCESDL